MRSMTAPATLMRADHRFRAVRADRAASASLRPRDWPAARPICPNIESSRCGSFFDSYSASPFISVRKAAAWASAPCFALALLELRHQIVRACAGSWTMSSSRRMPESSSSSCVPASAAARICSAVGRDALLLAQHFGVVDLLDFDARTAGGRPQMLDAAVAAHFFGRAREQQQQRAPRLGVGSRVQREAADQMAVQEVGELGDRLHRASATLRPR